MDNLKSLKRIAYKGPSYTVEWYFDKKGKSQAYEYYVSQPEAMQRKLLNLFRLMSETGKIFDETKFRNEGDGIYAFKPQPDRYLCFFFKDKKIVVTNAFWKKTKKLPQGEKDIALKAYQDYSLRIKEEIYYDKEN